MHLNIFFFSSLSVVISTSLLIFILIKHGNKKIHKVWALMNFAVFIWGIGATAISLNTHPSLANIIWRLCNIAVAFISVLLLHMAMILVQSRTKTLLLFACLQATLLIVFFPTNLIWSYVIDKYYNLFYIPKPGKIYFSYFLLWILITAYAHSMLIKFYLSQEKEKKSQAALLFSAIATGCICGSFNFLYFLKIPFYGWLNFGITFYCIIVTYAIFKHQLLGIEIIYKRGLLYSILIAFFAAIYFIFIFIAEWLFRGIMGYKSIFLSLFSALAFAALFNPLRNWAQNFINKIFHTKTIQEISMENELLMLELERSERLKAASTLALGLAHEIKNPLTVIKTFTEYLSEKKTNEKFIDKFCKIIPREVERINNIVHRLLDFSKPSPPVLKQTMVCNIIKEILELMSNDFLKKKIQIVEQNENHDLFANIDADQIKQVFFNILINAMDAMPNGGNIYISIKEIKGKKIEITLRDEGSGISKENLKNIFDPFFSTKDKGTGLGLAISHQIIQNHNGTIEIQSELNRETSVTIRLPQV
ncbi:MAG: ATP-binding protein [Candidatus Velamenicoccus archaeovorus]